VSIEERLHAGRGRDQPTPGARAVRPILAVDHEPMVLPVEVIFPQACQLRDTQAGIEQGPDYERFPVGLSGIGQGRGFGLREGFAFILVRHKMLAGSHQLGASFPPA
jgi:hypothetical protein